MFKRYGSIYRVSCLINGKTYIGQTVQIVQRRFSAHLYKAKKHTHNQALHAAIRLHGPNNFVFEEVFVAFDKLTLDITEELFIVCENTLSPHGYNLLSKAGSGSKMSQEAIDKAVRNRPKIILSEAARQSISNKAKERHKIHGHPQLGRAVSEETKHKISIANTGNTYTEDRKQQYSIMLSGSGNPMFGKKQSDITKKRISDAKKQGFARRRAACLK